MKHYFIKLLFICGIGLFIFEISYADSVIWQDNWKDILNPFYSKYIYIVSDNYVYTDYNNNLCDLFYEDIEKFFAYKYELNKKRFAAVKLVFNCVLYILSIGWSCCGFIGFIWLLWAVNRMYTGGAVDHD